MTPPSSELAGVGLFARVPAELLASLDAHTFVRRLGRGQVLFVAGEPADHVYLVRRGRLKVHVTSEQGADLVLAVLGPGDSLGEVSVVDAGRRSADVEAIDSSELLALPVEAARGLLRASPEALAAVAEGLAAQVRALTDRAADLVFLDLPRRLAKLLVTSAGPGPVARLGLHQAELAALLGVTRQSLNRTLTGLARRGWVEVDGTSVRLLDAEALGRFARG